LKSYNDEYAILMQRNSKNN